ncbi:MAG: 3-phosphoshikimate 1-carboxyvinyltransferase [Clostridiales bacterium]|nr:3-phosphoshikimate 1-carboxyvinyltransferase [Candidatus Cacconaster stercorequi]
MNLRISPRRLWGTVTPPSSKSLLHRELIASALAGEILSATENAAEDVQRTAQALRCLWQEDAPIIDCGDSGSTLRFLLPVAMARRQVGAVFTGSRRLLERPIPDIGGWRRCEGGIEVMRPLTGGRYLLSGDQTSQIISGLLMALPLCPEDSEIILTTPLVSRPYVDLTVVVLRRHGIVLCETPRGWQIPGGQKYCAAPYQVEGDWSAAAWYEVLNALGGEITVRGMNEKSLQGDRQICAYCKALPDTVDVSRTPDLLPPLALLAALQSGKVTHLTGAAFLRGKESNRLHSTAQVLNALGGCVEEQADGLVITGVSKLTGGCVDSWGDHRIVMLAACAAMVCEAPVTLRDAGCVSKSYPDFWNDYVRLHGAVEVTEP